MFFPFELNVFFSLYQNKPHTSSYTKSPSKKQRKTSMELYNELHGKPHPRMDEFRNMQKP